jgi:hypothetical protein
MSWPLVERRGRRGVGGGALSPRCRRSRRPWSRARPQSTDPAAAASPVAPRRRRPAAPLSPRPRAAPPPDPGSATARRDDHQPLGVAERGLERRDQVPRAETAARRRGTGRRPRRHSRASRGRASASASSGRPAPSRAVAEPRSASSEQRGRADSISPSHPLRRASVPGTARSSLSSFGPISWDPRTAEKFEKATATPQHFGRTPENSHARSEGLDRLRARVDGGRLARASRLLGRARGWLRSRHAPP